jgi:hypothetical protein
MTIIFHKFIRTFIVFFVGLSVVFIVAPSFAQNQSMPNYAPEDKMRKYKYNDKLLSEPWWRVMASCSGKLSASAILRKNTKEEAALLKQNSNVLGSIAIIRLVNDRKLSTDNARKLAQNEFIESEALTKSSFNFRMIDNSSQKYIEDVQNECFAIVNQYATEFPETFAKQK